MKRNPTLDDTSRFPIRYPDAMTDSGEYTSYRRPPGSNVVEAEPDEGTTYTIRKKKKPPEWWEA